MVQRGRTMCFNAPMMYYYYYDVWSNVLTQDFALSSIDVCVPSLPLGTFVYEKSYFGTSRVDFEYLKANTDDGKQ